MKRLLLALLIISVLVIVACSGGNNKVTGSAVSDCNDNNACTTDFFDETSKVCAHEKILGCCGNNICEAGERCDTATYTTSCKSDCQVCPANIDVSGPTCESGCSYVGNSLVVNGNTKIVFLVKNDGEEPTDVKVSVNCLQGRGIGSINFNYYGVSSGLYFDNGLDTKNVAGKSTERVVLDFAGYPNKDALFSCDFITSYKNEPASINLFELKLKQP